VTHDALRKTPCTFRNSTAVRATAAAPERRQPRHKIVATWRRNSEHRGAWLHMATGWPMARQSGYSEYIQGVKRHACNLWVKVGSIVHTLPEVTSPQTAFYFMLERKNKPCFGSTEHLWQRNVREWRQNLFNGGKTYCTLWDLMFWWRLSEEWDCRLVTSWR